MRYKNSIKIIIDKRKLDTLLRLNCPMEALIDLVFKNKLNLTGDSLIDDNLESLLEIKEFNNWGGSREGSGRPHKNQLENQVENQVENQDENQDANQVGDKDKDIDIDNTSSITNSISNKEYKEENIKIKRIYEMYNEICTNLPKASVLNDDRKNKIKNRLKYITVDDFKKIFEISNQSDFLTGKTSNWKANLDWLIKNNKNYLKVLEGNYNNKEEKQKTIKWDY